MTAALPIDKPGLRNADTNTLLRLYDRAQAARRAAVTLTEQRSLDRELRLLARELRVRRALA
jgi:hypothetical protein